MLCLSSKCAKHFLFCWKSCFVAFPTKQKMFSALAGKFHKIHKIFETNSSFHMKQRTTEKGQFPFFSSFLLVLATFPFWEEDCALGYNSSVLSRSKTHGATYGATRIYHVYH